MHSGVQEEAVNYIASMIHSLLTKDDGKRRLFLIQTYVIGKERILIEASPWLFDESAMLTPGPPLSTLASEACFCVWFRRSLIASSAQKHPRVAYRQLF